MLTKFKREDAAPRPGARALTLQAINASRRARRELLLVIPLIVATVLVNEHRREWFDHALQKPVRLAVAISIAFLGYRLARDLGPGPDAVAQPPHGCRHRRDHRLLRPAHVHDRDAC